ncbi:MAG: YdeI/OmpD-associated family protein [Bacteroidia bacterium]
MDNSKNPAVDQYLAEGCKRCPLGGTPACKVHTWERELPLLRMILLDCGLTEERKWSVPTYTFQSKNIAVMAAFKEYCSISFFKGALLDNSHGLLESPGENSQSVRLIRFTSAEQIMEKADLVKACIFEAIEVEKAGLKVNFKKIDEFPIPDEFQIQLDTFPDLKAAFEALTPGRQRGYIHYFSQPKQSKTREARVQKYIEKILNGEGFHD